MNTNIRIAAAAVVLAATLGARAEEKRFEPKWEALDQRPCPQGWCLP